MKISPLRFSEFSLSECTSHDITSLLFYIEGHFSTMCGIIIFTTVGSHGKMFFFSAYLNAYEIDFLFGVMIFNNEKK